MKQNHILVAEDDTHIRTGLVDTLESEGYKVTTAADGIEALELFQRLEFNLIVLDIMMPAKSGYDVCREIREINPRVPIIMLTAKGEEIDKVLGWQLGADDYITKPFGVRELLARIAAVLRRIRVQDSDRKAEQSVPEQFHIGRALIDAVGYRAQFEDNDHDLSSKELELLKFFYLHPDQVLSRDRLLNAVWGIDYYGTTRTLDQHIARIRKKIEAHPAKPDTITTVHGVGYKYEKQKSNRNLSTSKRFGSCT